MILVKVGELSEQTCVIIRLDNGHSAHYLFCLDHKQHAHMYKLSPIMNSNRLEIQPGPESAHSPKENAAVRGWFSLLG